MPTPNQNSTVGEMKAYIRSKKLNHPLVRLGLKKADLIKGLKKLGHWSEAEKMKKTRKTLSKGQKDFLGGIDDKPAPAKKKAKAKPAPKTSVTVKGKKFSIAPSGSSLPGAKKGGVVSLEFLKELSKKKGFSFDPTVAFKSLKVGNKMFLDYDDESKAVEIVSSDDKGITFNEFNYKTKVTKLHSGPNTIERPSRYTQTILGDKKKQLKLTWSQFYHLKRTKNTPNVVRELKTEPYSR